MKLSEYMDGMVPDPAFEGPATANNYIVAIDFDGTASDPNDYIMAAEGMTQASGALNATTQDTEYLYSGKSSTKTGTQRVLTMNGDRIHGAEFQEKLLEHTLKYGVGQSVIKGYVYFNSLTGKGEKGRGSLVVEDDMSGGAGANASWSATLTTTAQPTEYTYATPPTP